MMEYEQTEIRPCQIGTITVTTVCLDSRENLLHKSHILEITSTIHTEQTCKTKHLQCETVERMEHCKFHCKAKLQYNDITAFVGVMHVNLGQAKREQHEKRHARHSVNH